MQVISVNFIKYKYKMVIDHFGTETDNINKISKMSKYATCKKYFLSIWPHWSGETINCDHIKWHPKYLCRNCRMSLRATWWSRMIGYYLDSTQSNTWIRFGHNSSNNFWKFQISIHFVFHKPILWSRRFDRTANCKHLFSVY